MLFRSYLFYGLMVLGAFSWAAWSGWKVPRPSGEVMPSGGTGGMGGGHIFHGGSSSSSGWSWGK